MIVAYEIGNREIMKWDNGEGVQTRCSGEPGRGEYYARTL